MAQTNHGPIHIFHGDREDGYFGFSVSGVGDVDGDGTADLIVGMPMAELFAGAPMADRNGGRKGTAVVLSGADGRELHKFSGGSAGSLFGHAVSGAGDVNGDGTPDLIVGAPLANSNGIRSGSTHVRSGADGSMLHVFHGDSAGDSLGLSVDGAGDINGDGHADLIIGSLADSNNGLATGSARVLSGANGNKLYEFHGDADGDMAGWAVAGAGDVNGDGTPDLIVGAPTDRRAPLRSGTVRLYSGADGKELHEFSGDVAVDHFGFAVSGVGDVNGDGRADLIVGAPNNKTDAGRSGSVFLLGLPEN